MSIDELIKSLQKTKRDITKRILKEGKCENSKEASKIAGRYSVFRSMACYGSPNTVEEVGMYFTIISAYGRYGAREGVQVHMGSVDD